MKRLETYAENKTVDWAKRNGILTTKLKIEGQNGWPDRAFWLPGTPAVIEFKRIGERPRKLQFYIMKQLAALGYNVFWTDNYEEAVAYLEACRKKTSSLPASRGGVAAKAR